MALWMGHRGDWPRFCLCPQPCNARASQTNAKIAKFYGVVSFLLVGLNGWANFNSLPGIDPLIQMLVALVIAMAVIAFPVVGLALIERGFAELGD